MKYGDQLYNLYFTVQGKLISYFTNNNRVFISIHKSRKRYNSKRYLKYDTYIWQ